MENSIKKHLSNSSVLSKLCHKIEQTDDLEPHILQRLPQKVRQHCQLLNLDQATLTLSCKQPAYFTELFYAQHELIAAINQIELLPQKINKIIWRPSF